MAHHLAAREGHLECLKLLIKAGCDVMAKDRYQMMAHHVAAQGGHPECLEVLIKAGCDVMAEDKVGDE